MYVILIIAFLYLLFARPSSPVIRSSRSTPQRPIDNDVEDYFMIDYLSDGEINGR